MLLNFLFPIINFDIYNRQCVFYCIVHLIYIHIKLQSSVHRRWFEQISQKPMRRISMILSTLLVILHNATNLILLTRSESQNSSFKEIKITIMMTMIMMTMTIVISISRTAIIIIIIMIVIIITTTMTKMWIVKVSYIGDEMLYS